MNDFEFEKMFNCKIIVCPINYKLQTSEIYYWKVYLLCNNVFYVMHYEKEMYSSKCIFNILNINANEIKFTNNLVINNILENIINNFSNNFEKENIVKFNLAFNLIEDQLSIKSIEKELNNKIKFKK